LISISFKPHSSRGLDLTTTRWNLRRARSPMQFASPLCTQPRGRDLLRSWLVLHLPQLKRWGSHRDICVRLMLGPIGYICSTQGIGGTCIVSASSAGRSKQRRAEQLMLERVDRKCQSQGFTACMVPGGGWECVDTASTLEMCGGCTAARVRRNKNLATSARLDCLSTFHSLPALTALLCPA
jgi:hypothetical protein